MGQHISYCDLEPVEVIESVKGLWDGRGWVSDRDFALKYPARTFRAHTACRIVADQTGQQCWVIPLRPGELRSAG